MKVAVCDYRAGNIRSVEIALRRLGAELVDDVAGADLAVLPGVGSAGSAMAELRRQGLDDVLRARGSPTSGPVLGICLGLQLALEHSEEDGGVDGLGILPGRSVRLTEGRVPRIGWAEVDGTAYYFAHSLRRRDAVRDRVVGGHRRRGALRRLPRRAVPPGEERRRRARATSTACSREVRERFLSRA